MVVEADAEHEDAAIGAFLNLLAKDIETCRHVQGLPDDLVRAMLAQAGRDIRLELEIDGDVAL